MYITQIYIFGVQNEFNKLDGFEWDEGNCDKNRLKHRVSGKECEEAFSNEPLIILEDHRHSDTEQRYAAYGATDDGRKLHIVFTGRKTKYRVISARDMHRKERRFYAEETEKNS